MTLFLHALGHFHPASEITNEFLESLDIGTDDEWIMDRVGIRSRRTVLPLDYIKSTKNADVRVAMEVAEIGTWQMSARAAEMALKRAGVPVSDIGLVIAGSSASDWQSPADACMVAAELGIDVPAFDVNSACTSFLAQMHVLSMMQPEKLPDFILICGADSLTKTVDYADRSASVLWGDGAAAAVISTRERGAARVLGTTFASRPSGADKVVVPRAGYFGQDGRTVQTFAIRKTALCFDALRDRFDTEGRPFHFVGHQANLRMLEAVCRRAEIPEALHHFNVEWYGNTGAASSAGVISMSWEKWNPNDDIAVVGVGAGLTWASYLLRFDSADDSGRDGEAS